MRITSLAVLIAASLALASPGLRAQPAGLQPAADQFLFPASLAEKRLIRQGRALIEQGKLQQAIETFRQLWEKNPQNAEAPFWLSVIYSKSGDYKKALQLIEQSIDLAPESIQLQLQRASILAQSGRPGQAEIVLTTLLKQSKSKAELQSIKRALAITKGNRLVQNNNLEEAVQHYRKAIEDFPKDLVLLEALGQVLTRLERWDEAERVFHQSLKIAPRNPATYLHLARLYQARGDDKARLSSLRQVLELDGDGRYARQAIAMLLAKGREYLKRNELPEALVELNTVVAYYPNHIAANLTLAQAYQQQRRFKLAEASYRRILAYQPNHQETRLRLGRLYYKSNRLDEAIDTYKQVIAMAPGSDAAREADNRLNLLYVHKAEQMSEALDNPEAVEQALKTAQFWMEEKRLEPAQWLLASVVDQYPDNAQGFYLLGLVLERRGQIDQAVKALARGAWLAPKNIDMLLSYARVLDRAGDLSSAEAVYRDALALVNGTPQQAAIEKLMGLTVGSRLVQQGQLKAAARHYEKLLQKMPDDVELLSRLANTYLSLGKEKKAETLFDKIARIEQRAQQEKDTIAQGRQLLQQGKLKQAEEILSKVIKHNPNNAEALYWLAIVYARQGHFDHAENSMRRSVELAPNNYRLLENYAGILLQAGQLDKAEKTYKTLLAQTRSKAERRKFKRLLWFVEGQRLLRAGKLQQAMDHYVTMTLMFPRDVEVLERLAAVYTDLGFWDEAETTYRQILAIDARRAITHLRFAHMYGKQGNQAERRKHLARVIQLNPNSALAQTALKELMGRGRQLIQQRKLDEALAEYQTILSVLPAHVGASLAIAKIYQRQQAYDQAEAMYLQVLAIRPADLNTRALLAALYFKANRLDDSIKEYQKILAMAPNSDIGDEADAKLNILYSRRAEELSTQLVDDAARRKAVERAAQWIKADRLDPAQWLLNAVVEIDPDNAAAHFWLGKIFQRRGQYEQAIEHIGRSVRLAPDDLNRAAAYGEVLTLANKLKAAEAVYNNLLDRSKDPAMRRSIRQKLGFVVGQRLVQARKYKQALRHYGKMQKRTPNDLDLLAHIADVYLELKKYTNAETLYQKILKQQPNHQRALLQMAKLRRSQGKNKAYMNYLRRLWLVAPGEGLDDRSIDKLGLRDAITRLRENRWKEAIVDLQRIIDTDPNNLYAWLGLATAYAQGERTKQADEAFAKIVKLDDNKLKARLRFLELRSRIGGE